MTTKTDEETKTLFPNLSDTQVKAHTKTEDSQRKPCLAKLESDHDSGLKSEVSPVEDLKLLASFGTFKHDPADALNLSQPCKSGGSDSEVVEVIATLAVNDYELPRTQSRYMGEIGNEPETLTESLDAPSTPMPEVPTHELTTSMDTSSNLNQELVDDIPDNIDTVHPLIKSEPLDDEVNLRPAKRTRYFLEAVELPTLASVLKRENSVVPIVAQGNFDESIGKFTNPKVKRKKDYVLSVDTVRERMRGIPEQPYDIPLDQGRASVMVTRQFLSTIYGGNSQMTFPKIADTKLATHGLDDFMYPNLDMNPYAPEVPGARGLFFVTRSSDEPAGEWPQVQRVITRIASAQWQYVGQYRLRPVASLSKEEWVSQGDKVRNTWVKEIMERDWGRSALARIHLRKILGRKPTDAERDEEYGSDRKYEITPEDVNQAFVRGEECIAVWTMECIDYDVDFQLNLVEKFPLFVPPPSKKKKAAGAKKASVKKDPAVKTGSKRKWSAIEPSHENGDGGQENSDGTGELEGLIYTPRGTRSRPHTIL